mmetsp:Transcript_8748/g.25666  ORF Transcript_8748/g.25666 Transcript_8748/m.25666 type:complete len:213 (+) Transcript_8748:970-1608(+)
MRIPKGKQLPRLLLRRLPKRALEALDTLRQRGVVGDAGQVLCVLVVGGLQGLQLLRVPLCRVPEKPLQVEDPLLHRGLLVRLRLPHGLQLLAVLLLGTTVLRVAAPEGLNITAVPLRHVTEQALKVVHALAQRGVLRRCRAKLLGVLGNVDHVPTMGCPESLQVVSVPASQVRHQLLELLQPSTRSSELCVSCPDARKVRSLLAVGLLDGLQ